jgi:hypothetical protein
MPYEMEKLSKKCYRVYNRVSNRTFSKCTSKKNAIKQLRLLRAMIYNKHFIFQQRPKKTNRHYGKNKTNKTRTRKNKYYNKIRF